jgi:hypothetical protein
VLSTATLISWQCSLRSLPVHAALQIIVLAPMALLDALLHDPSLPYIVSPPTCHKSMWVFILEVHFHTLSGGFHPPDQQMIAHSPTEVALMGPAESQALLLVVRHAPCALHKSLASVCQRTAGMQQRHSTAPKAS